MFISLNLIDNLCLPELAENIQTETLFNK